MRNQNKLFQEHGHKNHMLVVWKFFCGLKVCEDNFQSIVKETKGNTLFQIQCAYESQQLINCAQLIKAISYNILLEEKYLSTSDFAAIGYVVSTSIFPFKLSLIDCSFDSTSIDALLSEMGDEAKNLLHDLHIQTKIVDTTEIRSFGKFLPHLQSLKCLFLKAGQKIWPNYADKFFIKLANVTELSIINTEIQLLMPLNDLPYTKLTKLNLRGSIRKSSEIEVLAGGLQYCRKLEELDLSDNNIDECGLLADSLKDCRSLKRFNISDNNNIPNSGVIAILNCFGQLQNLELKSTDIVPPNRLSDGDLLYHLNHLESLDISLNTINSRSFWLNSKRWNKLNELIVFSQSRYNIHTNIAIFNSFQHFPELLKLVLNCSIDSIEGARTLMTGLIQCPKLQVVDFSDNIIRPAEIEVISANLEKYTSLKELHLNNNEIGDVGAKILSSCLQNLCNLRILSLGNNSIQGEGSEALAANLHHCTQLRRLDLQSNDIDDEAALVIVLSLNHNCRNFKTLNLSHTIISNFRVKCQFLIMKNNLRKKDTDTDSSEDFSSALCDSSC